MSKMDNKTSTSLTNKDTDFDFSNLTLSNIGMISKDLVASSIIPHDNEQDIIAAIILSKEIGISPMAGLMMGKKLNRKSIYAVIKGKALGLDPISSIEGLHYINDSSSSTGIHIMTSLAITANVHYELLADFAPVYGYITEDKEFVRKDDFDSTIHQIVSRKKDSTIEVDETKLRVKPIGAILDYKTTIRFKRTLGSGDVLNITLTYYFSEFKNLHKKDNWLYNKKTMLRNRVLAIGYRLVADDVLNGLYEVSEITDTLNIKYETKQTIEKVVVEDVTSVESEIEDVEYI